MTVISHSCQKAKTPAVFGQDRLRGTSCLTNKQLARASNVRQEAGSGSSGRRGFRMVQEVRCRLLDQKKPLDQSCLFDGSRRVEKDESMRMSLIGTGNTELLFDYIDQRRWPQSQT